MKTTLLTALAMVIGFTAFLLWYSPRRIVARARARGVYVPPMGFEYNKGAFL